MYYTYMLRCADNSIYTGMTNDLNKRINEHLTKDKNGAKYTKSHNAVKLESAWKSKDKSLACKLEYQIKTLSKMQKESLINGEKLIKLFPNDVNYELLGSIYLEQKNSLKAYELFEKAFEMNKSANTFFNLTNILYYNLLMLQIYQGLHLKM